MFLLVMISSTLQAQITTLPHPSSKKIAQQKNLQKELKGLEQLYEVSFIYKSNLLDGVLVPAIDLTSNRNINSVLTELLKETDISFLKFAEHSYALFKTPRPALIQGTVLDKKGEPLNGATIQVKAKSKGAVSNMTGGFSFELDPGVYQLEVSYVGYEPLSKVIEVEFNDSLNVDFNLRNCSNLGEVVLVGSRLNYTSLLKKTNPVDIVTEQQMQQNGAFETSQLLQYTVPSFHSTYQTISDGTDHIDPAALRGLGPDQLLVLINGKRRHTSALVNINGTVGRGSVATDLNAIPSSAIKKIEVLRDGASVQYGSDAIAGVINIILKENTKVNDINVIHGLTSVGDGKVYQINSNHGLPLGKKGGYLNITSDFTHRDAFNRAGVYTGDIFGDGYDSDPVMIDSFFANTGFSNRRVMSIGSSEKTAGSIFVNLSVPVSEKFELYAFGGSSYRLGKASGFYRFPYQQTKQSGIYPLGFSPKLHANIIDHSISFGIKSNANPWKLDFSNTTGSNKFDFIVKNSNNASLGLASPTQARAGGFSYTQNVTNFDVNRSFKWKIPIHFGIGSEFKVERFEQRAGEEASYIQGNTMTERGTLKEGGFQLFPGFRPENEVDEYRINFGVYSIVEAELTKAWLLSFGSRYEYYSDFGSQVDFKLGTRYAINKRTTLRGTFNTGFRAPSINQIYLSSRTLQFISQGSEQVGVGVAHFNNLSSASWQLGIKPLSPETSKNYSFGIGTRTDNGFTMSLDFYNINIKNRIVITGRLSAEDHPRFREVFEPFEVNKAQFFTNAIDTRTIGTDLSLGYQLKVSKSKLKLNLAANINNTRLKRKNGIVQIKAPELLRGFESILFNREEVARIEHAQPNSKLILTASYTRNKIEVFAGLTRFGEVNYIHPHDGNTSNWPLNEFTGNIESRDQIFSSKWITDASLSFKMLPQLKFTIGGNNIFNVYPDAHQHSANTVNGLFKYSRRVQQFGIRGAFFYAKMNYRL